jgi:aryl-alcohol dehydrogenase-like predicted oxidoreductase
MRWMKLGHTGVDVSALSLGCMWFGSLTDEQTSFQLLDQYVDAGGSFLDTANNYAFWIDGYQGGESEQVIGRWMRQRRNRARLFVASKVGFNMPPRVPTSLARTTIFEQCDNSLRQLQTDYLDLYYAHWDHRETPLEEALEAFDQLVRQGKVRYIGCSNILAWRIAQARALSQQHGWAEYCCVQQRHTYIRPKTGITSFSNKQVPVNVDLLDYATVHADTFTVVAYSTLLGGVYSHPQHRIPDSNQPDEYDAADMQARLHMLQQVAEETGATPNQVVLAWLRQHTPAMIALIASSSRERLQENLDSVQVVLTADQLARLNQATA